MKRLLALLLLAGMAFPQAFPTEYMLKRVYDTNGDGSVDKAATITGGGITGVSSNVSNYFRLRLNHTGYDFASNIFDFHVAVSNNALFVKVSLDATNWTSSNSNYTRTILSNLSNYLAGLITSAFSSAAAASNRANISLSSNGLITNGAHQNWGGFNISNVSTVWAQNVSASSSARTLQLFATVAYLTNIQLITAMGFVGNGMSGISITNATSNVDNSDSELLVAAALWMYSNYVATAFATSSALAANALNDTNQSNTMMARSSANATYATNVSNSLYTQEQLDFTNLSNRANGNSNYTTSVTNLSNPTFYMNAAASTTSATFVLVATNFSNIIAAGKYSFIFSCQVGLAAATTGLIVMATNGVQFTNSLRVFDSDGGAGATTANMSGTSVLYDITLAGTERFEVYFAQSGGTLTLSRASLRCRREF